MYKNQISHNALALLLMFNVGASLIVLRQYDRSLELTAQANRAIYSKAPDEHPLGLPELAMVKIDKVPRRHGSL